VAVAVADLDRDGDLDLVVTNQGANTVSVLLGTGTGGFGAKADFPTGLTPVAVAIADLDRDGDLDLVVTNRGANTVSALLNGGPPPPCCDAVSPMPNGGSGCVIATAAFGSPLAPQVQLLREFRDRFLLPHPAGRELVALYYTVSPPLARVVARSETLRAVVRVALAPIIHWAALALWSPTIGLGVLLLPVGLATMWVNRRARRPGQRSRCEVSGVRGRGRRAGGGSIPGE
jgi:hypothetical protein